MAERWLAIPGYEGAYEVSDAGRVRSLDRISNIGRRLRGQMMALQTNPSGYLAICLFDTRPRRFEIHRLVLSAFVGPSPEGMEACHNNGTRTDNRLENLRWDTRSANHRDAIRHGTHRGFEHGVGRPMRVLPLSARSHCPHGHAMTRENSYFASDGRTRCRKCVCLASSRYAAKKRARTQAQISA